MAISAENRIGGELGLGQRLDSEDIYVTVSADDAAATTLTEADEVTLREFLDAVVAEL